MVCDDQEPRIRLTAHLIQQVAEAGHVGIIQRRVDLVQNTNRCRVRQEDGKDQRHRGQRLFAAGQQTKRTQFLTGRLAHDLKSGF